MKRKSFYTIIASLIAATLFFAACTEDITDTRLDSQLATTQSSDVTSGTATVVGFVVAEGDGFTEKGVCYSTQASPTTDDNKAVYSGDEKIASFTITLTGLSYATTYYARAYGVNSNGTFYGEDQTFTTLPIPPALTTAEITGITGNSASGGGSVSDDGGGEITVRGIVYGTEPSPTLENSSKTTDGTGTGDFESSLTDLSEKTTYYVRAYATNAGGTGYGPEVSFKTLSILTWHIPGDYAEASYPNSTFANWTTDQSPLIKSTYASPGNLEGYVYMANATNQWKFVSQGGTSYGDDGTGHLHADGDNMEFPAGYYKINVDTIAMTYTAVATTWGVIGDATPNGWTDETPLAYDPASATWQGVVHLKAAALKFRANHSWDYNYGSTAKDATLDAGGSDIAMDTEADYVITLDLSQPNNYTYSANRWGIIGDATPDGWDADQNMTWDDTSKVFTVTLDLTAGGFKFRANDGWDLDYGDDEPDGTLNQGGENINIAVTGNYTVSLDLKNNTYSVVKN